jgi:sugar/nucleoside kinase (ribokinase family)
MSRIAATGLIALDIVFDDDSAKRLGSWAGGTCGNLTAITSFLGWHARPIARLDSSSETQRIRSDLRRCGVDLQWLSLPPRTKPPIYIQRLTRTPTGVVRHRFERFCPTCGGGLPRYRSISVEAAAEIAPELADVDVFFFDRVSRGNLVLAEAARQHGALVVFEPSTAGQVGLFKRAVSTSHIVKYARDRLSSRDREIFRSVNSILEIETLGRHGLRYRRPRSRAWRTLDAFQLEDPVDTAGAGDWTTAGLIVRIGEQQADAIAAKAEELDAALDWAQALGALSCMHVGPRGLMRRRSAAAIERQAREILGGTIPVVRRRRPRSGSVSIGVKEIPLELNCLRCA